MLAFAGVDDHPHHDHEITRLDAVVTGGEESLHRQDAALPRSRRTSTPPRAHAPTADRPTPNRTTSGPALSPSASAANCRIARDYLNSMSMRSDRPHILHRYVRRSWSSSGAGSMQISDMGAPQMEQGGRYCCNVLIWLGSRGLMCPSRKISRRGRRPAIFGIIAMPASQNVFHFDNLTVGAGVWKRSTPWATISEPDARARRRDAGLHRLRDNLR